MNIFCLFSGKNAKIEVEITKEVALKVMASAALVSYSYFGLESDLKDVNSNFSRGKLRCDHF